MPVDVLELVRRVVVAWAMVPSLAAISTGDPFDSSKVVWRAENRCGLNCVYFLLRFDGRRVNYGEIETRRGVTRKGLPASLFEIRQLALGYGLGIETGRTNPDGLKAVAKPCIAHLESTAVSGTATGHFVVVVDANDKVIFVDGTTAETVERAWPEFLRVWSGYIAFQPEESLLHRYRVVAASFGMLLVSLCGYGLWRKRKSRVIEAA